MSEDIASLVIRVESLEAKVADDRLDKLEKTGARTERATDGLTAAFKRMAGPLLGIVSISEGLDKLYDATTQIQNLRVQLETATGSAEKAGLALDALKAFAEDTGQPVSEVAEAFVKLKNFGLDPSERALLSYGNTASALGKDLDQLIEAVADATTGEFERLKEFGIKASQEGENVSFTFRGVTTTVKKNSEEIQEYLQAIGNTEFAGTLEKQAVTAQAAAKRLQDSWDDLFQTISEKGAGDLFADSFNIANDSVKRFTQSIASGELEGHLAALGGKFDGFVLDIINGFNVLEQLFREEFQLMADTGGNAADFLGDAFLNWPENVRAAIQIAATELAYFVDRVSIFGEEIAYDLNPKNWFGDSSEFEAQIETRIAAANQARTTSIATILEERDAKLENFQAEVDGVNASTEAYLRLQEAKKASNPGLGQFSGNDEGETGESTGEDSAEEKFSEQFEILQLQLELEETAIEESFVRRQQFLNRSLNANKITQAKFDKETLKNQKVFLTAKEKEEAAAAKRSVQLQQGLLGTGLQLAEAAFQDSKSLSKGIAGLKTIESVVSSYAAGAKIGGPPVGAAFAGLAWKAQREVSGKLDSTSIGGGTPGGISYSTDTPSVAALDTTVDTIDSDFGDDDEDETSAGGNTYYNFYGLSTVTQAEQVMELFREGIGNDEIPIDPASRQAQVIRDS